MQFTKKQTMRKALSLRLTDEQDAFLLAYARALGLPAKVDALRVALDYFIEHSPDAQGIATKIQTGPGKEPPAGSNARPEASTQKVSAASTRSP